MFRTLCSTWENPDGSREMCARAPGICDQLFQTILAVAAAKGLPKQNFYSARHTNLTKQPRAWICSNNWCFQNRTSNL
jgi:hypothetical protein